MISHILYVTTNNQISSWLPVERPISRRRLARLSLHGDYYSGTKSLRGRKIMNSSYRDTGQSVAPSSFLLKNRRKSTCNKTLKDQNPKNPIKVCIINVIRPTSHSIWKSLLSLSYLNNQTINAYSHLVGSAIFLALPWYFYEKIYNNTTVTPYGQLVDLVVVSTYCLGVAVCFAFSAT